MAETSLKIFYPSATDYVKSSTAEALQNHLQKMAATTNAAILSEIGKITQIIELTGGEDLNDFRTTGRYILRLASTAGPIANLPPWITTQNVFLLDVKAHTVGGFQYVMQDFSGISDNSSGVSSGYYRRNTSGASGALWIPWRRMDNDVAVANGGAGNANRLRVQEFRDAMGTRVTDGKAAVALRFDHGLSNFNSKIRPLLEARNLPYCLALSSRGWSVSENAGVTASMVNSWNRCEVWNHGAGPNHNDASDLQTLTDQIVKGKEELQAQLPDKKIWGFIPPGVGGTNYGGFNGGESPEAFYGTLAGQLILEHHAVSAGAFTGTAYRPLDGEVRQGMAHAGLETRSVSSLQSLVNTAIANHSGLQLMTHPSRLDESGYHTTAQLTQMLDYIVAKRDAGELMVLSPYEMMVAELFASSGGGSVPGPPGAGVPAGGEALQVIRKNAFNTTTEWATLTKSLVGLSNVDNTSDMNKPVSTMQKLALDEKADKADLEGKADLVGGKVPVAQLPADLLVTDANVSAQVNSPQTGAAIDQRINTQVTPVVEQITADYIASDRTIVDAAAAAVNANPKIAQLDASIVDLDERAPNAARVSIPGVLVTVLDANSKRTWLEANDDDAGPTPESIDLLVPHLPLSKVPDLSVASAQVSASKARALRKHLASTSLPTGVTDVTANGQAARITWPAPGTWDYLSPVPVLLHFGGVGDTSLDAYEAWAADVAAAGIVVARCLFHGDSYGNQNAMDDAVALVNHVLERAPVSGVIAYGHSMGGIAALNTLTTGDLPTVVGVIITDGVASLRQRWDGGRQAEITTAYGITTANPYEVATRGFDPMLEPASSFRGVPIGIVGSDADTSVPFSAHGRALAAKLAATNPVTVVVHTGAHNIGRWNVKQLILDLTAQSLGGPLSMPAATL